MLNTVHDQKYMTVHDQKYIADKRDHMDKEGKCEQLLTGNGFVTLNVVLHGCCCKVDGAAVIGPQVAILTTTSIVSSLIFVT